MADDFTPTATVIADSLSPLGDRLTTIEATFHRFVLAEFNTHRAFSRNSASSRAIPVAKMIAKAVDSPAIPVAWAGEKRGMQGGDEITDPATARTAWLAARDSAVTTARRLADLGVHKSVVNRLLEPFLPHTVIVSATDYEGFFEQRCSLLAQPEIRLAAEAIHAAYAGSTPALVDWGDWHLPYLSFEDKYAIAPGDWKAVSAARCARVSYLTHDGRRDPAEDITLYGKLISAVPPHASPLEHVATPAHIVEHPPGNFRGWHQLRHRIFGR